MRWIVVACAAGCYSPAPPAGAPCGIDGECPTGLHCSPASMTCELHAVDAPPALRDGSTSDGPVDARPLDAPRTPWRIVHSAGVVGTTLGIQPTTAGDLLVVAVQVGGSTMTDDAGNTYVPIPTASATNSNNGTSVEFWYVASALAGATSITVDSGSALVEWEVSGIRAAPFDSASVLDDQPATTDVVGAPITTSVLGEFVVSVAIVANSVGANTVTGNAFTNDYREKANGWAHLTADDAAPGTYQAEWTQNTSGTYCAGTVAFFPSD